MSKYQQLTNELVRETVNELEQSQQETVRLISQHPVQRYYHSTLICALELMLQQQKYRNELSSSEWNKAKRLKTYLMKTKDPFDRVLIHLAGVLRDCQRGIWIFDFGTSNGFFYEGLLGVMQQLKYDLELSNIVAQSQTATPRAAQVAINISGTLMLQRTLERKNKLSSVPATPAESDNESDTGMQEFIRYNNKINS